jgi:Spy/CpxP family protein refolding chaperone
MKMQSFLRVAAFFAVAQIIPLTIAQTGDQTQNNEPRRLQKLANLTPAERQQLKAAHHKAMQDPAVRAAHLKMREAHKEYRNAMRASMLKADPTIQPVLNKVPEGRAARRDS